MAGDTDGSKKKKSHSKKEEDSKSGLKKTFLGISSSKGGDDSKGSGKKKDKKSGSGKGAKETRKFVIKAYERKIDSLNEEVRETRGMLEEKQKQFEMAMTELKRTRKNFDEYKGKVERDKERAKAEKTEKVLMEFLEVMDNLERASESAEKGDSSDHIREGIKIIMKQFTNKLRVFEVARIDSLGELFDPTYHEAVAHVPSPNHFDGEIMQESQTGYMIGERLLRPAKVIVSNNPDVPPPEEKIKKPDEEAAGDGEPAKAGSDKPTAGEKTEPSGEKKGGSDEPSSGDRGKSEIKKKIKKKVAESKT